ncbi:MAG TPA: hypothetical protein VFE50_21840 [Cyclobacteriaceae bacterium]|nr:hypothetical protein [Cyclobacteriaceae bacterium]
MKSRNISLIVLIVLLVLCVTSAFPQMIRRVNNNPGVVGANIYSTIQAAHDAAANGDIIYLEHSTTAYGGLNCTKLLKIYGPGYLLDENAVDASTFAPQVSGITFSTGSAGSSITGFQVNGFVDVHASDITISRMRVTGSVVISAMYYGAPLSNFTVEQTYMDGQGGAASYIASNTTATVSNVIFQNNQAAGGILVTKSTTNVLVKNNTIQALLPVSGIEKEIWNTLFENNIIIGNADVTFQNCVIKNNVAGGTGLPANVANQNSVVLVNEFKNPGDVGEKRCILKDTSPLKTAGSAGTEVGAFGGDKPYRLAGQPPIPVISKFLTSPSGSNTTPLSVTISTKSNN